jgi:hypothetical protein
MVVFRARQTLMKIDEASDVTITTSAALDTFYGSATTLANVKNVTIAIPEGAVDKIDLIGVDGNSFQNQDVDIKPFGMATLSGTLVHGGDEVLEPFAYGSGTAIAATHHRYRLGDGNRPTVSILTKLTDGTDIVNVALDNAYITKLGDAKLSGADGHWEQDFNITCLPRDTHVEYKD